MKRMRNKIGMREWTLCGEWSEYIWAISWSGNSSTRTSSSSYSNPLWSYFVRLRSPGNQHQSNKVRNWEFSNSCALKWCKQKTQKNEIKPISIGNNNAIKQNAFGGKCNDEQYWHIILSSPSRFLDLGTVFFLPPPIFRCVQLYFSPLLLALHYWRIEWTWTVDRRAFGANKCRNKQLIAGGFRSSKLW